MSFAFSDQSDIKLALEFIHEVAGQPCGLDLEGVRQFVSSLAASRGGRVSTTDVIDALTTAFSTPSPPREDPADTTIADKPPFQPGPTPESAICPGSTLQPDEGTVKQTAALLLLAGRPKLEENASKQPHQNSQRLPPDASLITGTITQYNAGGVSCCGRAAALFAAEYLHPEPQLTRITPETVDRVVRAAAVYKSKEHTYAVDAVDRTRLQVVAEGLNAKDVSGMLDRVYRHLDQGYFPACAALVTRSMETVCVAVVRADGGFRWVYFDSHGRPERDLRTAFAVTFSCRGDIQAFLSQISPFLPIDASLADIPQYSVMDITVVAAAKGAPAEETSQTLMLSKSSTAGGSPGAPTHSEDGVQHEVAALRRDIEAMRQQNARLVDTVEVLQRQLAVIQSSVDAVQTRVGMLERSSRPPREGVRDTADMDHALARALEAEEMTRATVTMQDHALVRAEQERVQRMRGTVCECPACFRVLHLPFELSSSVVRCCRCLTYLCVLCQARLGPEDCGAHLAVCPQLR